MEHLLIVDDDTELCAMVREYLEPEGFEVKAVHGGEQGLRRVLEEEYSLLVLDVMLPEIGGFEVLRRLRAAPSDKSRIPVLMLTARGDDVDRIVGLEMGADDYLAKPFNPRELVARIRAILRRAGERDGGDRDGSERDAGERGAERGGNARDESESTPSRPATLHIGDLELLRAARLVRRGAEEIEMTSTEFDLLAMLLEAAGEVVTREAIARHVFERKFMPLDRSIDMHVSNIRKKLGPAPHGGDRIKTVRGTGYIYVLPVAG